MKANQKLVADDGYEVALFPLPYLCMSQDEGGDFSHLGTYNVDLLGYNPSSNAPLYAPCKMKVVAFWGGYSGGNQVTFQSVDKVHLPNGHLNYLTIGFGHDPNPPYTNIGQEVEQGQVCYHTGTYGHVTGDHVHTCAGEGTYIGYTLRETGHYDLSNRIHYWDALYVNDTEIIRGFNHNWQEWDGNPYVPPEERNKKKSKFPFPVAWKYWGYKH